MWDFLVQAQHPPDASIYPLGPAWLVSSLCCISAPSVLARQLQDLEGQETDSLPGLLVCSKALFVHGGERQLWIQRKAQQTLCHSSPCPGLRARGHSSLRALQGAQADSAHELRNRQMSLGEILVMPTKMQGCSPPGKQIIHKNRPKL